MRNKILLLLVPISLFFASSAVASVSHPRYNMTVSEECNFVWFRVAKVATRTLLTLLKKEKIPFSLSGRHLLYDAEKHKKKFKFAFVRNPWARVVSCYFNKVVTEVHEPFAECFGKDFEYFVHFLNKRDLTHGDVHIRLQSILFPLKELDFIGRLENFSEDLNYVFDHLGLKCRKIPQRNASLHKHYSHYYTKKTKKIIAKKYCADIVAFGYTFEKEDKFESKTAD